MTTKQEKLDALTAALEGWKTTDELQAAFGWRAHTVRGRISDLGKTTPIERKRENGVTSYRIKPAEAQDAA